MNSLEISSNKGGPVGKPTLLFLTNLYNGAAEEDIYLSKRLREWFEVYLAHPLDSADFERDFDAVLVRNVWPTHEYRAQKTELLRRLLTRELIPLSAIEQGYLAVDNYLEKEYLVELYRQGYPVIPTVDRPEHVEQLGPTTEFFIKPKDQCDGEGSERVRRNELASRYQPNYLIQPYVRFDSEICFYFVDGEFVYAFSTSNRLTSDVYVPYTPTPADMEFALSFVRWNGLAYGLQRIDAVRVSETQTLLLTEVEDFGPYLFLLELPEEVRERAVQAITKSLLNRCSNE